MKPKRILMLTLLLLGVSLLIITVSRRSILQRHSAQASDIQASAMLPQNLDQLLLLKADDLRGVGIARMNLLCAQGLPGAEDLDLNSCLATLQDMAVRVSEETERYNYRFERSPADFENSEGFYKMGML